jgi:SNF2 family DNA or RNA helicase
MSQYHKSPLQNNQQLITSWLPPGSRFKKKVTITKRGNRLWLQFPYDKRLLEEVKTCFTGPKWHGFEEVPVKQWSIKDCPHNWWTIAFLSGKNPYQEYKGNGSGPCLKWQRSLYEHQSEGTVFLLDKRRCILAWEMGSGKTLSVIEAIEQTGKDRWLYVAPRSALHAVQLEFEKWDCTIMPEFVTYASLSRKLEEWTTGVPVWDGVVFDESHKVKTPTAKRTIAATYISDAIRNEHDGYVWLLTGSPAPKSPLDWYSQCEIACPGFLKEGSIHKFKERLSIVSKEVNPVTGGAYQSIVAWRDDPNRCNICGELKDHINHNSENLLEEWYHEFKQSENEVAKLYKRMQGLVSVKFKKDCLDLPEKRYIQLTCKPSQDVLRAARLIVQTAPTTIKALTQLRELSDGFQYITEVTGRDTCPVCRGKKSILQWVSDGAEAPVNGDFANTPGWESSEAPCEGCKGTGEVAKTERTTKYVDSPKNQILRDLIDQHDEVGRLVVYAGFTGSIDRIVDIIKDIYGWEFIRVDGRGWNSSIGGNPAGLLRIFQEGKEKYPRVIFVGAPGAAGTGLTLTASPSIVYYSNDFNAESRIQSEDRIHRPGMDTNRGATIYDIINLPIDSYVLDNLKKKRELQSVSLGELERALK